ncbi:MAG: apolipoprotein N-acyltransferase [Halorhodospira sp.]
MARLERLAGAWHGVLAAGLAGALLPLAFAPVDWSWLAVAAPAVLLYVAAVAPRRRALQAGYAFGLGEFGVGVSWVFVSINEYGGAGPVLAALVTVLLVAGLALFPVLAVAAGRACAPGRTARLLLALPAAWLLVAWLRTWLLTGFPWLFLGYATLDTPLAGLAPVGGVLGLTAVLALLAGAVAWLAAAPSWRRGAYAAALAGLAAAGGVAGDRASWTEAYGEPQSVALLQGSFAQDVKWDPSQLPRILERYTRLTEAHLGADLIVWPETAVPRRFDRVAQPLEAVAGRVREAGGALVLGIPYRVAGAGGATLHNSVVAFGRERAVYHKRHLVPYGEYVPLRSLFGRSLDFLGAPLADYEPGPAPEPLRLGPDLTLGATVCYEVAYPNAVRRTAAGADVLVNLSNDAWFGDSLAPDQHLQKARMRAAESGRWLLRATNTGITALIGPQGRVAARSPQFEVAALTGEVRRRRGATPYTRLGDAPLVTAAGAALLGLALAAWYRRRGRAGA